MSLFSVLYSAAFDAIQNAYQTVRNSSAKLVRGDQSRSTVQIKNWSRVIVRLDLYIKEGQPPAVGTGFFLNIPGSKQDVIVTAGHNLIQPVEGKPILTPKIGVRLIDPGTQSPVTKFVTSEAYHITSQYKSSPGLMADSADDYGVILIDRPIVAGNPRPRDAFGFNVTLAAMDLSTDEPGAVLPAQVGGYPGISQDRNLDAPPNFEFGIGTFGKYADRRLYYHGGTEQGMSGGPVWVNFLGNEIVVGIHNKHEQKAGEGNRGARLSIEVIQNICKWAGATDELAMKAIRVHDANPKGTAGMPPEGLFVQSTLQSDKSDCPEPLCYAWSGANRDPALTTFDIIPAQSCPTYSRLSKSCYIIAHSVLNMPQRFLQFNTDPDVAPEQVTLTEKPTVISLVKLYQGRGSKKGESAEQFDKGFKPADPFQIRVFQNHDTESLPKSKPTPEFKLILWAEDIPPANDPFGLERARLGLLMRAQRYRAKPPCDYEDFLLQ